MSRKAAAFNALMIIGMGLAAQPALAQDKPNYVTVFGGGSYANDAEATGAAAGGAPRRVQLEFESDGIFGGSYMVGGAVGRRLAGGAWGAVRVEGEVSHHSNEVEDGSFNGGNQVFSGEQSLFAGFLNAAYDTKRFNGLFGTQFSLSAGGGIGLGKVEHEVSYAAPGGATIQLRDGSTEFAYQAFVGSDLHLNDTWSLYSDLRFIGVTDPEAERFNVTAGAIDSRLTSEYSAIALTSGVRVRF